MSCADMFRKHENAWLLAFDHDFLHDCKNGTIGKAQFDAWLVQDYLFVREFTRLAATLLTKAPHADFDVLLGGLEALRSELTWFQVRQACCQTLQTFTQMHQWLVGASSEAKS